MVLVRLEPLRVYQAPFGTDLNRYRGLHLDLAFVFAKEIDRSHMGAQFFFEYIAKLWADVLHGTPDDVILIEDWRLW